MHYLCVFGRWDWDLICVPQLRLTEPGRPTGGATRQPGGLQTETENKEEPPGRSCRWRGAPARPQAAGVTVGDGESANSEPLYFNRISQE